MSSLATASRAAEPRAAIQMRRRLGVTGDAILGLALAGALVSLVFLTTGGTDLAPNTWVQIVLIALAAGVVVVVALVGARARAWGGMTLLLFAALAALTYASIGWSVQPATSWLEANRTLSYLAAFAAPLGVARVAPGRWRVLVGAIGIAATALSAYALLVKVFPASLDPGDAVARLRAPFGYWNATGLIAAMGLPVCVWAGARREAGRTVRALSIPAIALLVAVVVLSYSRGAVIAAAVGLGCWFALEPLRLRSTLVLALGAAGAALPTAWALSASGIAKDGASLHARTVAGHQLGLYLLIMLAALLVIGFAAAVAIERVVLPAPVRRRIGGALLALLALVPVAGVVALATSARGFTGSISQAWTTLTNPHSIVREAPGRLAQLGSSRPRYWKQGMAVGEHAVLAGVGARGFGTARTRYSSDPLPVADAHSYVIETFADFGVIGLALSLGLLVAWGLTARRVMIAPAARAREYLGERAGLSALLAVVVIFGISSLIDWTWFIPGVTVPALLCAGWLAGRGPLSAAVGRVQRRSLLECPGVAAGVVGVAAVTLVAAWFVWQPLRSVDADAAAIDALLAGHGRVALAEARTAVASNPISADALSDLAAVYAALGDLGAARSELVRATSVQPGNPATWLGLAEFELEHGQREAARRPVAQALRLDPGSTEARQLASQAGPP